ncbi:hypothetical protein LSAT2_016212 [Lamellibrachia satsuma]|nr:hypothetical protein LSAT2_016212 [Lamellibrachia satsuma]
MASPDTMTSHIGNKSTDSWTDLWDAAGWTEAPPDDRLKDELLDVIYYANFYCIGALVVIGIVCNVMSMGVFASSRSLRRTTTGHYLIALSAADLLYLLGETLKWLTSRDSHDQIVNFAFVNTNDALCKTVHCTRYSAKFLSSWITVAITIERFLTVAFPLRVSLLSTPRLARVCIAVIAVTSVSLNVFPVWTVGIKALRPNETFCVITAPVEYELWNMVVLRCGQLIVPSILILVFTVVIVYFVIQAARRRQTQLQGQSCHLTSIQKSVEMQLTAMLIAVAVSTLLLRLPYATAFYLKLYGESIWSTPIDKWQEFRLVAAYRMTEIFAVLNYVLNFFLYCLCGSTFRNHLRRCIRCAGKGRLTGCPAGTSTGTSYLSHTTTKLPGTHLDGDKLPVTHDYQGVNDSHIASCPALTLTETSYLSLTSTKLPGTHLDGDKLPVTHDHQGVNGSHIANCPALTLTETSYLSLTTAKCEHFIDQRRPAECNVGLVCL